MPRFSMSRRRKRIARLVGTLAAASMLAGALPASPASATQLNPELVAYANRVADATVKCAVRVLGPITAGSSTSSTSVTVCTELEGAGADAPATILSVASDCASRQDEVCDLAIATILEGADLVQGCLSGALGAQGLYLEGPDDGLNCYGAMQTANELVAVALAAVDKCTSGQTGACATAMDLAATVVDAARGCVTGASDAIGAGGVAVGGTDPGCAGLVTTAKAIAMQVEELIVRCANGDDVTCNLIVDTAAQVADQLASCATTALGPISGVTLSDTGSLNCRFVYDEIVAAYRTAVTVKNGLPNDIVIVPGCSIALWADPTDPTEAIPTDDCMPPIAPTVVATSIAPPDRITTEPSTVGGFESPVPLPRPECDEYEEFAIDKTYTESRGMVLETSETNESDPGTGTSSVTSTYSTSITGTFEYHADVELDAGIILAGAKAKFGWKVSASVTLDVNKSVTKDLAPGQTLFHYAGFARVVADGTYTEVYSDCTRKDFSNIRIIAPYAVRTWHKVK